MTDQPAVSFIGNTIQVAIVSENLYQAIDQLTPLGVGPFAIYHLGPHNTTEQRYRGRPAQWSITVAFTTSDNMMWEVVQPGDAPNIHQDFLDAGHSGLHHIAVDAHNIPFAERAAGLAERGYQEMMGGKTFDGQVPFGYFHNGHESAPIVEVFEWPADFTPPDPEETYPRVK